MNIKESDWVIVKEDVKGEWSGSKFTIEKGSKGRVLKLVGNDKANVSFGMARGVQTIELNLLQKADS